LPVRYLKYALAAAIMTTLAPRLSIAQSTTSLLTNATVLPRRTFGVRILAGFERTDALVGDGPTRNIASILATDSLDAADHPQLALANTYIQQIFQSLGASVPGFRVNAGKITATANSRIATFPLIAEYGLTSRLTVGVVVPFVETRTTLAAQLNRIIGDANVGPNPSLLAGNWTANAALAKSVTDASTALQMRLSGCQATPSGTDCTTILAQQAAIQSLIQNSTAFAGYVQQLYGTGESNPGLMFVPLATGAAQIAIVSRLDVLKAQFQSFGVTPPAGFPTPANSHGARNELQRLLGAAGYDSLASTDRSGFGDISIGASYQLANSFSGRDSVVRGLHYRVAVNATARIGTGQPAQTNRLFDNATGYGQPGVIVGGAVDLQVTPRVYANVVGSFTKQLGTIAVNRIQNAENSALPFTTQTPGTYSAGDVVSVSITPRYRLGGYLSFDGNYTLTRVGADSYSFTGTASTDEGGGTVSPVAPYGLAATTAHQVGFGFSYSTLVGNDRGPGRIPYEASFRHVETIAAGGGPARKIFEDRLQLRVFFR
jgi:hypothetical protein